MKILPDGRTNLTWRQAKGHRAINAPACTEAYRQWWVEYISEHPDLLTLIQQATGLSDMFGREGSVCQADILWTIRNESLS
jgi:hypothetical protein